MILHASGVATWWNIQNGCSRGRAKRAPLLVVYKLEMTSDHHGDIVTASCGCPADGKPHDGCKHIAALCYALEAYCRLVEETRQDNSCTSRLQVWNRPRKRRLPPQEVEEMFVKEEYGKSKRPMQPMVYDPRPTEASAYNCYWNWSLKRRIVGNRKKCCLSTRPAPSKLNCVKFR